MAEYGKKICEINGKDYDKENDYLVQTWMVSAEDGDSDNMCRHGFRAYVGDEEYYICRVEEFVPRQLIDVNEGETVTINLIGEGFRVSEKKNHYNESGAEVMIPVTFTASQTKYRYRRFGNFEDIVERVCQ